VQQSKKLMAKSKSQLEIVDCFDVYVWIEDYFLRRCQLVPISKASRAFWSAKQQRELCGGVELMIPRENSSGDVDSVLFSSNLSY
jgi:hypothetical protein